MELVICEYTQNATFVNISNACLRFA